jgi:Ca-activated chloride channel family protein
MDRDQGHGPEVPRRQGNVGLTLSLDTTSLATAREARVHLVAALTAHGPAAERARAPVSVVLALDVSGSMAGPPLGHLVRSVDRLVGLLEPHDQLGIVAFSSQASVVLPLGPVTAEHARLARARVGRLGPSGSTNIEGGLLLAKQLFGEERADARHGVLLLSDGEPNVGASTPHELALVVRTLRPMITVSSLGYGAHHHEDVLAAVAKAGAGRYTFIPDPLSCHRELAQALGTQGDVTASGVELSLALEPGVEVVRVLESPELRFGAEGLVVTVPDLVAGGRHVLAFELRVRAPREPCRKALLRATLSYLEVGARARSSLTEALEIGVTPHDGSPVLHALHDVLLLASEEARAAARAQADRGSFEGAAAALRAMIRRMEAAPGWSPGDGSALAEALELLLDEALAMERRPKLEDYKAFKRSQLSTRVGTVDPALSKATSMRSQQMSFLDRSAGLVPVAHLEVLGGMPPGRFPLRASNVLGRTSIADVVLPSSQVSRQHANVFVLEGDFFVADLGSTATTRLNGRLVSTEKLSHGDVLELGDVRLRFVLGA